MLTIRLFSACSYPRKKPTGTFLPSVDELETSINEQIKREENDVFGHGKAISVAPVSYQDNGDTFKSVTVMVCFKK